MITIFRDKQDAYTKHTAFRRYREEARKSNVEQRADGNIVKPDAFSNIYIFPDPNIRG